MQAKVGCEIDHGYFISPKLYALKTLDGNTIVKAKGIGSKLNYNQFESLINNEAIVKAQERWFKDPANASINLKNIDMHISSLNLKREQLLVNNRLSQTIPFNLQNGKNFKK